MQTVAVDTVVVRADGTVAARMLATGVVAAGASTCETATFPSPHLWNGVADPYLYTVYAEISVGGTVTDVVSVPFGFRFFRRRRAGLLLNGQYLDLHGVNRHQDRLSMGWADRRRATRRGHGADPRDGRQRHSPVALRARRALPRPRRSRGVCVWAEIPLVNSITDNAAFTTTPASS